MLLIESICKSFPGVRALDHVSMQINGGEVLSIIGENGAGKSTLMKILAGVYQPDAGKLVLNDKVVRFSSATGSLAAGIGLIHQELNLASNLTIAQNIFLNREPHCYGLLREKSLNQQAQVWLDRVGLNLSPQTFVSQLSIAQQQLVEIAKALATNARLLIMDEPTSSLSIKESQNLFTLIHRLRSDGVAVVYISHRLAEVADLSDRVEVLRDGVNAGSLTGDEISHDAMVKAMVGRDLNRYFPHVAHPISDTRLELRKVIVAGKFKSSLDLSVRGGEIVGIAGLVGAGRTELLECIMGLRQRASGIVAVDGLELKRNSTTSAIAAGVMMIPEDRRKHGLITALNVEDNLTLPSIRNRSHLGWMSKSRNRDLAKTQVKLLRIKTPRLTQTVACLSGGNQQKIVFGKWLLSNPKVLLLDEPTRGVDIGAKQEIYAVIEQLAGNGAAILLVSSEMEEIIGMSDRVLVMHNGRIAGELTRELISESAITNLAFGTTVSCS